MPNRTALHKLSLLLLVLFILAVFSLVFRQYSIFVVIFIAVIIVAKNWYGKLGEELIIYRLKQNDGRMQLQSINNEFVRSGEKSLSSLSQRGIIRIEKDEVYLVDSKYIGTFNKNLDPGND